MQGTFQSSQHNGVYGDLRLDGDTLHVTFSGGATQKLHYDVTVVEDRYSLSKGGYPLLRKACYYTPEWLKCLCLSCTFLLCSCTHTPTVRGEWEKTEKGIEGTYKTSRPSDCGTFSLLFPTS